MRRTTIFLPDDLHERIRGEAFQAKISMAEAIRERLRQPARRARTRSSGRDPLMKVAGVCHGPLFSGDIDEALYGR